MPRPTALLLPLCLFASSSVIASDTDKIISTLTDAPVMICDFVAIKKVPGIGVPLESSGKLIVSRESGLVWKTTEPFEETYVFGKEKSATIDETGKVTVRANGHAERIASRMSDFAGANRDELNNHFFVEPQFAGESWSAIITPKNDTIRQFINESSVSGKNFVNRVMMNQGEGVLTEILFSNHETMDKPDGRVTEVFGVLNK